jgi:hypothetical protein
MCMFVSYLSKHFPKKNALPLVLFLSSILSAQSASMYVVRLKSLSFGYHNPSSKLILRYMNIHFTSFNLVSLGVD